MQDGTGAMIVKGKALKSGPLCPGPASSSIDIDIDIDIGIHPVRRWSGRPGERPGARTVW